MAFQHSSVFLLREDKRMGSWWTLYIKISVIEEDGSWSFSTRITCTCHRRQCRYSCGLTFQELAPWRAPVAELPTLLNIRPVAPASELRFHPSDEEVAMIYPKCNVVRESFRFDVIASVDIDKIEPWDIPDCALLLSLPHLLAKQELETGETRTPEYIDETPLIQMSLDLILIGFSHPPISHCTWPITFLGTRTYL